MVGILDRLGRFGGKYPRKYSRAVSSSTNLSFFHKPTLPPFEKKHDLFKKIILYLGLTTRFVKVFTCYDIFCLQVSA